MLFSLNALVRRPPDALVASLNDHPHSHVTRQGTLVVKLLIDRRLSAMTYPAEWTDKGSGIDLTRFRPDFSHGRVHAVHRFPEQLAGVHYWLLFDMAEVSLPGSYCQVITDYEGDRPGQPYRRESSREPIELYYHATSSVFSLSQVGRIRLDANAPAKRGELRIHRATAAVEGRLVVSTTEQLLSVNDPRLATAKLDHLPEGCEGWNLALRALYERMECRAHWCEGHYHSG